MSPMPQFLTVTLLLALGSCSVAWAGQAGPEGPSWPCYRGPAHNGLSTEGGWKPFGAEGPKVAWKAEVGDGYSCISVSQNRALTQGNKGGQDTVYCFDASTGQELWKQSYPCGSGNYNGPRATPAIDGKVVYTLSRKGDLHAFDLEKGTILWNKQLASELKLKLPQWDFSSSPFVDGNQLVLNIGSFGVGVDKKTGQVAWSSGGDPSGYATPVAVDFGGGKRGYLMFTSTGLTALSAQNGIKLWSHPWKTSYNVNSADPVVEGNQAFISSGYGTGCALLEFTPTSVKEVWRNKNMCCHYNVAVLHQGHLYGFNDQQLVCLDFKSGAVKWSQAGLGKSSLIVVNGKLIIQADAGELVIAEASPEKYVELAKGPVLPKGCWVAPAFAGGRVYLRSNGGAVACVDLR